MIEFVCQKKLSEETQHGTKYEVWFVERGRVRREPSKPEPDFEWKRYEVSAEQYAVLRVGVTYGLCLAIE